AVPQEVTDRVTEIQEMLRSGELETGVDPVSGALLEAAAEATEAATAEATAEATATP
ncbi:MAG: hypothetical protein HXY40_04505, partial [Chloroflexi bacterium]|nr:hypothetical protein [Chloroflexota bacterium]